MQELAKRREEELAVAMREVERHRVELDAQTTELRSAITERAVALERANMEIVTLQAAMSSAPTEEMEA
ncbi:hypothetical protein EON67_00745, partial [archaeon]